MRFGTFWKGRDASVLLVQSLTVRIFISASDMFSSHETMFISTLEVLVRNDSISSSISNWTTLKSRHAVSLWMFPMHLTNVSTLPLLQYSVVRNKMLLKIDIKKRTPLNFIISAHNGMSLYIDIMWGGRGGSLSLWDLVYCVQFSPLVSEYLFQNSLLPLVHTHSAQENLVFHHPVSPRSA